MGTDGTGGTGGGGGFVVGLPLGVGGAAPKDGLARLLRRAE